MADILKNLIDADEVKLSLDKYNRLRDENKKLREENARLKKERDEICDKNKVRVIYKPLFCCPKDVDDYLVNFDDVKEEVMENYGDELERLQKMIDGLMGNIESQRQTGEALAKKAAESQLEVSRLKHRNLWQRIWNK